MRTWSWIYPYMVFGNDEERMAMMEDIEEEWEGDEEIFLAEQRIVYNYVKEKI